MDDGRPLVKCNACDGQGVVPLGWHLHRIMGALLGKGSMTVAELCDGEKSGRGEEVEFTAMSNRVAVLYDLGFVTRTKAPRGRRASWVYTAVKEKMDADAGHEAQKG